VNNILFFTADDGINGRELWKSDGTAAGTTLVKDILPGNGSAIDILDGGFLTAVNDTLFFTADNGITGQELWKSNGAAADTTLVKDIFPNSSSSTPLNLTAVSSTLFFVADDGTTGWELWKSNGAGTTLVKDILPGVISSEPTNFTAVNNILFFTADDGTSGRELWKSDGAGGATLVKDIRPGNSSSTPVNLTAVNNFLFFTANDGTTGREVWKSDGTAPSTVLVKDILPGSGSSINPSDSSFLTNVNGMVFFAADDETTGQELWGVKVETVTYLPIVLK
jgi:ELWxxDGT repeat protein